MNEFDEYDLYITIQTMEHFDMFSWFVTALSLWGAYLNLRKNPLGFILWAIADLAWFFYDISIEEYAQGFLFLIFFFLAVWGFLTWTR